jgi:hypothetical protein
MNRLGVHELLTLLNPHLLGGDKLEIILDFILRRVVFSA